MNIQFGGRVYLNKSQITGFNYTLGPYYGYISQMLDDTTGSFDPTYQLKGWHMDQDYDVDQLKMWFRQNNANSNCNWKIHLICQKKEIGSQTVSNSIITSQDYQFLSNEPQLLTWNIEDFYVQKDDLLSVAFERIGTGGSNRYYLYIDSATITLKKG